MRNSRNISDLRPDVAANAKLWLSECRAKGFDVEISNTVRDNEYQAYLYTLGRSVKKKPDGSPQGIATNGKTTTFHGAGLAIDFYSKSKGWSDHGFFLECAAIARKYGFSWAGDWKSFVEFCHIQWDNHRKSNHKNATQMPLYKEEEDMTKEEIKKIVDEAVAKALGERDEIAIKANLKVSPWAREAWDKAKVASVFDGTRPGAPLTRQEAAVIIDRMGLYGK